jgi:hypothetical protein
MYGDIVKESYPDLESVHLSSNTIYQRTSELYSERVDTPFYLYKHVSIQNPRVTECLKLYTMGLEPCQ